MKHIIVGGVAGGATVAARLRRNDEKADILMFEKGDYISYANCGLPYYIGETIKERDRLFVQTPERFSKVFKVDVRVSSEVIAINREKKTVSVREVKTGNVYEEGYDKLVLSPGAEPVRPPIPGINLPGIFTLRNVPDTDGIKTFIDQKKPRKAVIVGAGFIGLEMAENLHSRGILVTIVEMADQVMNILDYEMAAAVHQHLKTKNVEFYLKDGVASFTAQGERIMVTLKSGKTIPSDMVILSIGVRPENGLAKAAGIELGEHGGIRVNAYLATSDPNIYALGDAAEMKNPISGKEGLVPLAGPANKQGRILADNLIFGNRKTYGGSIGTGIAKVFDLTVASTGLSEKQLKRDGVPYLSHIIHSSSHAGYYPNAIPMSIKTIFSPSDGKVLGAQIVGYEGVDKRIDLFASVISRGGTVYDLEEIEHAYAPPYSSAKDPVNMAGFVGENILQGRSVHIHWDELLALDPKEVFLLDVRTREENALDTIEGAVNIPHDTLREHLAEIPKDKLVVIFCAVGLRGYIAERILRQNGFENVRNLSGGFKTYSIVTQKQSNEDIFDSECIGMDDTIYQTENQASCPAPREGNVAVKSIEVDACGLQCPGPILKLKEEIDKILPGERLMETATDPGFGRDVRSWCNMTGNRLVELEEKGGKVIALIEKNAPKKAVQASLERPLGTTIVVFSQDMDKALASFVIANGAASTGQKVTMFFTFWGLNVIKRQSKPRVRKDFMGRMFGFMLPSDSSKLSLSKLNMGGLGSKMMKARMKAKNVDSLEKMIATAQAAGIRLVGCQMSMDIMGVAKEELIDGVEIGGVAAFLEASSEGHASLFI